MDGMLHLVGVCHGDVVEVAFDMVSLSADPRRTLGAVGDDVARMFSEKKVVGSNT